MPVALRSTRTRVDLDDEFSSVLRVQALGECGRDILEVHHRVHRELQLARLHQLHELGEVRIDGLEQEVLEGALRVGCYVRAKVCHGDEVAPLFEHLGVVYYDKVPETSLLFSLFCTIFAIWKHLEAFGY